MAWIVTKVAAGGCCISEGCGKKAATQTAPPHRRAEISRDVGRAQARLMTNTGAVFAGSQHHSCGKASTRVVRPSKKTANEPLRAQSNVNGRDARINFSK